MTDSPMALFVLALFVLTVGELLAYFDARPGNTLSERIRAWASVTVARKLLLALGLFLLFTHLAFGWPW